jgi:hypothetical protein
MNPKYKKITKITKNSLTDYNNNSKIYQPNSKNKNNQNNYISSNQNNTNKNVSNSKTTS